MEIDRAVVVTAVQQQPIPPVLPQLASIWTRAGALLRYVEPEFDVKTVSRANLFHERVDDDVLVALAVVPRKW